MADKGFSLLNINARDLTKPLTKLIKTVHDGVGVIYEPTRIRRRAKAEADASIIKAEADAKIQDINYRTSVRINNQELRRQKNRESIVSKAAGLLPEKVSREKVDEDWVVQFFDYSQDVGNEEMQLLWARLLAGEITQPGTFSLRALQLVRLLNKKDARIFTHLCNYSWRTSQYRGARITHFYDPKRINDQTPIRFDNLLHLDALALISMSPYMGLILEPGSRPHIFLYCDRHFSIMNLTKQRITLPDHPFTAVGSELASLCNPEPDENYLKEILNYWRGRGLQVEEVNQEGETIDEFPIK